MENLTVTVIIPAKDAATHLGLCLQKLAHCQPLADEIIVVDDGSTDDTASVGESFGVKVIRLAQNCGPALARNTAAKEATGEILFFVDADVAVHRDTISRVKQTFLGLDAPDAVIGSYDQDPPEPNFISQYKNLSHCYFHQRGNPRASTFWTGCGAIRREVFFRVGGFSEHYRRPCVEDIEFGYRAIEKGFRIAMDHDLQVTHLKRWNFWGMIRTDVLDRGIPWTQLILSRHRLPDDLNLRSTQRLSAVAAWLTLILMIYVAFAGVETWSGVAVLLLGGLVFFENRDLYYFIHRRKGAWFTLGACFVNWTYLLYSALSFGLGCLCWTVSRPKIHSIAAPSLEQSSER